MNEMARSWQAYRNNIKTKAQPSLRELGIPVGPEKRRGFLSAGISPEQQALIERLTNEWKARTMFYDGSHYREGMGDFVDLNEDYKKNLVAAFDERVGYETDFSDERKIVEICMEFLYTAKLAHSERCNELIDLGVPVNFQNPRNSTTALHLLCSTRDPEAPGLRERLLAHPDIDLLLRDRIERQAWNMAEFYEIGQAEADKIYQMSIHQAEERGELEIFQEVYQANLPMWLGSWWYYALNCGVFDEQWPKSEAEPEPEP